MVLGDMLCVPYSVSFVPYSGTQVKFLSLYSRMRAAHALRELRIKNLMKSTLSPRGQNAFAS